MKKTEETYLREAVLSFVLTGDVRQLDPALALIGHQSLPREERLKVIFHKLADKNFAKKMRGRW